MKLMDITSLHRHQSSYKHQRSSSLFHCALFFATLLSSLHLSLQAQDMTTFYRASLFHGLPKTDLRDFTSQVNVRYSGGKTSHAFDDKGNKTKLFNAHGPSDLSVLGTNLQGISSLPLTSQYLAPVEVDATTGLITSGGSFTLLGNGSAIGGNVGSGTSKGLFEFGGTFQFQQVDVTIHHNLMHGFYCLVHAPFREVKLKNITATSRAPHDLASSDKALLDSFIKDLDPLLAENKLAPLTSPYHRNQLSDMVVSLGWQGYDNTSTDYLISSLQGFIQMGVVIPAGARQSVDHVFSVPLGYNKQVGVNTRASLQANALKYLGIGVQGGVTLFFNNTSSMRLPTAKNQTGWLLLQQARASLDQGQVWDIGAYVKADHCVGGLSALAGWSLTQQERSRVNVKDPLYLKDVITASAQQTPPLIVSPNDIANSSAHLHSWRQHTLHFLVHYDFGVHLKKSLFAPTIEVSYNVPIYGYRTFATQTYAGELSVQLNMSV